MLYVDKMQEVISRIQDADILLFIGAIAVVVFLIVVLVIIISFLRIKVYKDSYKNFLLEKTVNLKNIARLEQELEIAELQIARDLVSLKSFSDTRAKLKAVSEANARLELSYTESKNTLTETSSALEVYENKYTILSNASTKLKEEVTKLSEENVKCRANNSRLLMKLKNKG